MKPTKLLQEIVNIFPPLSSKLKKGECGRIAVVGGSYEFSGAPFYSAISALKIGGDLGHIFCNRSSSEAIKSYSPEIIVHPTFISDQQVCLTDEGQKVFPEQWMKKVVGWSQAINCWVIGPGLGRDSYMGEFFPSLVRNIPSSDTVVFNADGIYHLCQNPSLFQQLPRFKKAVLSTNERQWKNLKKFLQVDISWRYWDAFETDESVTEISQYVSSPKYTVILKGKYDLIFGERSFISKVKGGNKRSGGIGDTYAGIAAICTHWDPNLGPILASIILKNATSAAFQKYGRSLTAPYIIKQLPKTVMEIENMFSK